MLSICYLLFFLLILPLPCFSSLLLFLLLYLLRAIPLSLSSSSARSSISLMCYPSLSFYFFLEPFLSYCFSHSYLISFFLRLFLYSPLLYSSFLLSSVLVILLPFPSSHLHLLPFASPTLPSSVSLTLLGNVNLYISSIYPSEKAHRGLMSAMFLKIE